MNAGEKERVFRLFMKHQARLRAYCFSIVGDWHAAEDALQEAAVYIMRQCDDMSLSLSEDPGPWFRSIARLRALEQRRRALGKHVSDRLEVVVDESDWDSLDGLNETNIRERLAQCLGKIDAGQRELLLARYRDSSVRIADLAQERGLKANTLVARFTRLRRWLQRCIESKIVKDS